MAGSTFQPPIHLDPNQDQPQQISFINQNFQALASALETNSFRVVSVNIATIPAVSADGYSSVTVTHNLGFIPAYLAFIELTATNYINLPYFDLGGAGAFLPHVMVDVGAVTESTIMFEVINWNGNASNDIPVKYYLLQQSAN